jgi:hypothetical protein
MNEIDATDPMQLLELMRRDPGAGREAVQAAMMARAGSDPRVGALMGLLAQSQPTAPPPAPRSSARSQRIRQRVLEMREELEDLRDLSDELAAALGACALCWGEARDCEECRGRGRPGWHEPEAALFERWVTPALTRRQSAGAGWAPPSPVNKRGED